MANPPIHTQTNGHSNGHNSNPHRGPTLNINGNEDNDPDVIELTSDEFPAYFTERGGRLFHSSSSPYPLPVDTPEQERLNLLHDILLRLSGNNYIGPVPDVLAIDTGRPKSVLDVCTGNGKWVIEMAQEFPHVHFTGFDDVPIVTRYPPPNVRFEVDDVNSRFRWGNHAFDLVHARAISLATQDYPRVLEEMTRVLRPGGLFISSEWGHLLSSFPPSSLDMMTYAPASCHFHDAVNDALETCGGLLPISAQIPSFLASTGQFAQVSAATQYIPIGAWPRDLTSRSIGELNLRAQEKFTSSVKTLLVDAGWSESDIELLVDNYIREIRSRDGLVSVLYTVCARKV